MPLVALLLVLFSSHSLAGWVYSQNGPNACFPDRLAACVAINPAAYYNSSFAQCRLVRPGQSELILASGGASCSDVCPSGQERVAGLCVAQCAGGSVRNASGSCECPEGQEMYNGTCSASCGAGQVRDQSGVCVAPCAEGTHDAAMPGHSQNCVPDQPCAQKAGTTYMSNSPNGWYRCNSGCAASCAISITTGNSGNVTLVNRYLLRCEYTGSTCSTAPGDTSGQANTPPPNTDPKGQNGSSDGNGPCGPGSVYGEVNGVGGCYASSSAPGGINFGGVGSPGNGGTPGDGSGVGVGGDDAGSGETPGTGSVGGDGGGGDDQAPDSELPDHTESDADTFGEAYAQFADELGSTPIFSAIDGMSQLIPSGSGTCPEPGFDVFGQHFVINMHCTLYPQVASILSAVMMVVWTFYGLRIIASA